MPRAEVGTPKWLANKMKAKGLQRLRFYCQMCEKQCRDENGFKCHRMSEGHQRQMQVFMQRANRYIDDFSREFEGTFMQLMRTRYCRTRVLANTVYCELIADKQHIHMNATRWATLSEFVLYLKRSNKCTVEHSDQGWYLEYIDREKLDREARELATRKKEISIEEKRRRLLKQKIEDAWKEKNESGKLDIQPEQIKPFERQDECAQVDSRITIQLNSSHPRGSAPHTRVVATTGFHDDNDDAILPDTKHESEKVKQTALERLISENEKKKRKLTHQPPSTEREGTNPKGKATLIKAPNDCVTNSDFPWLAKGLVVRIMSETFADRQYFREKGIIVQVIDTYVGKIEVISSKDVILLDQQWLAPVVPSVGGHIEVLRGPKRGCRGRVSSLDLLSGKLNVILDAADNRHRDTTNAEEYTTTLLLYDVCKIES